MGLDQFWYKTKIKPTKEVDFKIDDEENRNSEEIYYHRKVPALQDYMTNLYLAK